MKVGKQILLSVLISATVIQINAQDYPPTSENWVLDPYRSDEFSDGFNLQKWSNGVWWLPCQKDARFLNENVSVQGGKLILDVKWQGGLGSCYWKPDWIPIRFSTGSIESKFTIGDETYVEVRAKAPNHRLNMNTAIWLSDKPIMERDPNVEIDILETFKPKKKPKRVSRNIHMWPRSPDDTEKHFQIGAQDYEFDWYISETFLNYGLMRDISFLHFYLHDHFYASHSTHFAFWPLNNEYVNSESRKALTGQQRRLILSVGGNNNEDGNSEGPNSSFDIDYVRVYIKKSSCDVSHKNITEPINNSAYIQAPVNIQASSQVDSNFFVTFKAPSVILKPGFHVAGSQIGAFIAKPEPCYYASKNTSLDNIVEPNISKEKLVTPNITPNPFSTFIIMNDIENLTNWSLSDMYGKVVKSGNVSNLDTEISVNTASLTSGIYYFKGILKNGNLFQTKIIKN